MKDSNQWFLHINHTCIEKSTNKLQRIVVLGNPNLFYLLKGKIHLHIDATFWIVPKEFEQLLVLMVFDRMTGTYIDVMYMLMTGKLIFQ